MTTAPASITTSSTPAAQPRARVVDPTLKRRRARAALLKRGLLGTAALAGVAALGWAFMPKPIVVESARVQPTDLVVTIDEDGTTRVKDRYVVSSPLLADAARSDLSAGDPVTSDTIVARLLPLAPALLDTRTRAAAQARVEATSAAERQAHAAIERLRTALEFARSEAGRAHALQAQGAAPTHVVEKAELEARSRAQELTSAEFAAKVADHELELARAALGQVAHGAKPAETMLVRSPIAGRVLRVLQSSAGVVQPGMPLLELGDPAALEVVVAVLTSDAVRLSPGARARIEEWGGEAPLEAHVKLIEPSAVTRISALGIAEQRVNVVLDLDSPREAWSALGDGYRVEARIVAWDGGRRLAVPSSAVFRRGAGSAVFRVDHGRAKLVPVRVGERNDEQIEVLSGIAAGAEVIVHPSDDIEDGTRVAAR